MISACHKKSDNLEYKKEVTIVLNNLDASKPIHKQKTLDTLYQYLLKQDNDSINRNLFFKVANKYYDLNKHNNYLRVSKKIKELAVKEKDTVHIAKSLYYIGDYYDNKSQLDSAFSYYSKSEKLYSKIKDSLNTGRLKLYKAGILFDAGNFTSCEIETINALSLLSKTNNTRLIYESYNLVALALKELNNSKKSLDYFDLAQKQLDKLEKENYPKDKIERSRIASLNNMGRVYEKAKNYTAAIHLYNKALQIKNLKQNYPQSYAMVVDNLAYSKMKKDNFDGVEKLLFESLGISDSLHITIGIVSSKINIGEYYLHKRDTLKGLAYIREGYILAKKIKSSQHTIQSLKLLMQNDSKNKLDYFKLYIKFNDSIQDQERLTSNKFARIAYETDQIEEKNELLSKRNTNIIIGSGITILLLAIFFVIYRLKSKNKELLFTQDQLAANERIYQLMLAQQLETDKARNEERKRIAMELHDGIVNSIFTTRFNLTQLDSNQKDKKEQLVKELEKAENEIRRVSHDLTQNESFEDKNLPDILASLVKSQKNQFNTEFDLSVDKYIDWISVSSVYKTHIYRIIQEAIQNVNKYAEAEKCYIMLLKTDTKITIRIWDNGIGFNQKKTKHGIGLINIKERTKNLNGNLKISSSIGKGTALEIIF